MQKQDKIIQMFNQIAPTYDKANRILSFGIDISWRKKACNRVLKLYEKDDLHIIDVACGTGDMIAIWQESVKKLGKKISSLRGVDPSSAMLSVASKKFEDIEFIEAMAQNLPLKSESADIMSISYGIRNVVDRKEALTEFARVLSKNGIFLVLEFTKREKGGFIAMCRDFYLKNILPNLGAFISKNKNAYEYLPNSIDEFLSENEFIEELKSIGFEILETKNFSFGISSMFIARKK
ncbi:MULTISPECIES: bifunctional demethylmenaquinone methyltransferase/2-methoxy-6-polyprenyl-1,4-benzoquinol methylase UbiE [unclassified Campylobacter]|uniref:bifunctional demethylmenaquinone methyltransferase/2-methoxy-6-polyprenyl-1,4-benzoquinol methylase UbiE n=1 Tax=unclassified Campylobacter TaxID=2593542 RepID=UPI0012382D2C|nr:MULTISPECIES: bifunctional demethylmenaquinone methyltransferase/2-methoxy-6-polyprenyl-1,4-benzoquinol methylase UbiE [unclassified Campylobacter]KAA6227185.1 bifunctional demethylmenaquinone methyltransferase/2-methoxy-6-polyprenyl-1,4-benzoquinol methylase UbiE [Campylobacter sp. LR286c]KAA6227941.1 bifunctional demethylmenaquinone methyltransferase/2-methoxy-6-polyprenyl-1,4-benzoquinol methylase UbiE [Campylobacter sp. LR185c]KAA6228350.1 bifunctional demethylmenaquinone methyltransferas